MYSPKLYREEDRRNESVHAGGAGHAQESGDMINCVMLSEAKHLCRMRDPSFAESTLTQDDTLQR
jgi:hypothetical protein